MTYLDLTIDESIGIQYVKEIADKWRVNLLLFALYRTVPCSNMGQSAPFGDDLSLTNLFASTSEKSYIYESN